MISAIHDYRFSNASHWQAGTLSGLEITPAGALLPIERLQPIPTTVTPAYATHTPAVNSAQRLRWRRGRDEIEALDDFGAVCGAAPANSQLVASPRWIADRTSLWAFDPHRLQVLRFDVDTLHLDQVIELAEAHVELPAGLAIIDIAGDGQRGLWLLMVDAQQHRLLHLDCCGQTVARIELPQVTQAAALAALPGAERLIVLEAHGQRLWFFDPAGCPIREPLPSDELSEGVQIAALADNGRDRVLLTTRSASADAPRQLWVLGANGAIIDGPLLVARAGGLPGVEPLRVHGLTGTGTAIWLATSEGLLRFDVDRSGEGAGNHGYFITPAMTSPERDTRRGWLRAEVDIVLAPGSVLEARYFSTSDPQLFQAVDRALRDVSVSAERRRRLLRELLGESERRRFVFAAAAQSDVIDAEQVDVGRAPLAVPLFDTTDRWLWLELAVSSAPASLSATVRELRVLYPDVSLVESLPAIYRGAKNDPSGTLRRLVGVIEATTQHLDQRIQHIHRLLNPATAPREWLDFIARWLDLPWDDSLELAIKRRLLSAAAELLGNRGTRVGLERLLSCLFGEGRVRILDVTADAGVVRLGGEGCSGVRLPALLAGAAPRAAVLGEKTVLGRARLPCADNEADPLADLAAQVRISIQASAELRRMLEPILTSLLAQYVPAELRLQIRWQIADRDPDSTAILILDEAGPARLAEGSQLGRTTLSGKWAHRLTDPGSGLRWRL